MKKLIALSFLIFIISCATDRETEFNLIGHIPDNTEIFISSGDLKKSIVDLENNNIIGGNEFGFKKRILKQMAFIKNLNLKSPSGISLSNLSSETFVYTLITKKDSALVMLDSVKNKSVETIKEEGISFQQIQLEEDSFFMHEKGSTAYISNSKQAIHDIGNEENRLNDQNFKQAYDASDPGKLSVIIKHAKIDNISGIFENLGFGGLKNFADWSAIDLDISNSQIKINGLSLSSRNHELLKSFAQTNPKSVEGYKVCPSDFISLSSLSYSSFKKLNANLREITQDSLNNDYPEIMDQTREISLIRLDEGNVMVLNTIEIEAAKEKLAGLGNTIENYRGFDIIELEDTLNLSQYIKNLIMTDEARFYTIIDHFVVLSNQIQELKKVLTAYQNSDIIAEKSYFTDLINSLSSESSMLFVARLPQFINSSEDDKIEFQKNSLGALQFINEGDFAHIHGVFTNSKDAARLSNGAEQHTSFKLDNPLITDPVFFKNHRTDQMDIAVQDENNLLYLISNKGNVFWKKQMDSKITSIIYQVDLFKNGNQQLAFSTGYHMEVLDRDGNKVENYPIKFNNSLTQPLAVFDYDNNRNYRFVLTQNKRVYMVGPKGKAIKGFDFEGGESDIVTAPKHIRLGNKDYILVAEESGKLNILSRQGNIRVPVTENIEFSENEWYGHNAKFLSTAPQNELIEISQQGQVKTENLELAENNRIVANNDHLVYLNENQLSIDGKIVNLDFGLYTNPQLFQFRKRTLIALTDTQTQKVFVFDENAELLEGFPVYGNSKVDIANADLDSRLELVVKGEDDEILIYKL